MALYKVAVHMMEFGQTFLPRALDYLEQAIRIYGPREYQRPQYARCLYRQSLVLDALQNHKAAQKSLEAAINIYSEIIPGPPVDPKLIRESDFDSIVAYDVR
ncbi:MAG: hypothetical protein Q9160_006265 [Pyrenula sp. 1 TL-2023]